MLSADMGRSSDRYLAIVVVLVVVQAAGFIAWKVMSGDDPKPAVVAATGSAPAPGGSALDVDDGSSAPAPAPAPAPENVSTPDAAPAPAPVVDDTSTADDPVADATLDRKERARKKLEERERARRAAELAREEKEERERRAAAERAAERARREAEETRRAEAEKAEKERQKLAAEAASARAAAEKARAEAEAAKREAERIAAAAAAKPTGSSKVLVLVLGPGASSSRSDIKAVYTGATSVWPNGTTARPYNRSASSGAGRLFYGRVLGMSAADVRDKWTSLQLSGGGIAPPTLSTASAVIQRVSGTRGAIGYVLESELPADTSGLRLVRLE
jgi:hypothetical protein